MNGEFSSGSTGWFTADVGVPAKPVALGPNFAMLLSNGGVTTAVQDIPVPKGATRVEAFAWVRYRHPNFGQSSTPSYPGSFRISTASSELLPTSLMEVTLAKPTDWQLQHVVAAISDSEKTIRVTLSRGNDASDVYFDNIQLHFDTLCLPWDQYPKQPPPIPGADADG